MKTSFPIIQVQIDEIRVDTLATDGTPYVFYLVEALTLLPTEGTAIQNSTLNVISFDRPIENHYWHNDSTWALYEISVTKYKYRGSISKRDRFDYSYQKSFDVYPGFKPRTWYLVGFNRVDGKKHHEFMYHDKDGKFTFYRLSEVNGGDSQ
jgi:hypothetical protein